MHDLNSLQFMIRLLLLVLSENLRLLLLHYYVNVSLNLRLRLSCVCVCARVCVVRPVLCEKYMAIMHSFHYQFISQTNLLSFFLLLFVFSNPQPQPQPRPQYRPSSTYKNMMFQCLLKAKRRRRDTRDVVSGMD